MPDKKYKGKKLSVVFPDNLFEEIERLAVDDVRSISSMVVRLCVEAIENRKSKHTTK